MKKFDYRVLGVTAVLFSSALVMAQEEEGKGFTISGSLQTDILFPEEDEAIGTGTYNDDCLSNTYLDLNLRSKYVDAGARVEYMRSPMPGFESGFAGQGLPHFYLTGKYKGAELTVGDFYEQFGSGLVLRTYEERSLGIDNSIRGGRLKFQPYKGIRVRMLGGNQRYYWERSEGYVYGADVELSIDQWSRRMQDNAWFLTLGGSYVGKFEKADDDRAERAAQRAGEHEAAVFPHFRHIRRAAGDGQGDARHVVGHGQVQPHLQDDEANREGRVQPFFPMQCLKYPQHKLPFRLSGGRLSAFGREGSAGLAFPLRRLFRPLRGGRFCRRVRRPQGVTAVSWWNCCAM